MLIMHNFLSLIRPKEINKSDKYSILFYKCLNKHKDKFPFTYDFKVLYDESEEKFNPSFPKVQYMYIGGFPILDEPATFIGNRINNIICDQTRDYPIWGYHNFLNKIDITAWFMKEYVRIGRCLFDPDHSNFLMDCDDRYSEIAVPKYMSDYNQEVYPDRKYCNWCGKFLHKIIKEEVKVEKKEIWVAF